MSFTSLMTWDAARPCVSYSLLGLELFLITGGIILHMWVGLKCHSWYDLSLVLTLGSLVNPVVHNKAPYSILSGRRHRLKYVLMNCVECVEPAVEQMFVRVRHSLRCGF